MRLFLSSQSYGKHGDQLLNLVGEGRNAVIIGNAMDYKPESERRGRVQDTLEDIEKLGFAVQELDLRNAEEDEIEQYMDSADLIWLRGGRTMLLMQIMNRSGLSGKLIQHLKNDRFVLGGYSAGAYVLGRTIDLYLAESSDIDQNDSENKPLNLVNFAVIAHWQQEDRREVRELRHNNAHKLGIDHYCLNDGDVVIVDGGKIEVLR